MTSDRNKKIEDFYHTAKELDPEERDRFLAEACADDPPLKEEIESLLKASEETGLLPRKPVMEEMADIAARDVIPPADHEVEPPLPFDHLGKFRLIRRLGGGGMGEVYLAEQESLGRQVALKIIRPDRLGFPEVTARFSREARMIAGIRHPNIVTVHDSGKERGVLYFAMELLPGEGLDEKFRHAGSQNKRIPLPELLSWFHGIASALAFAHEAGIIHRDVKPSNIRITPDDKAILMDFGIARRADLSTLTLAGEFRGTPHYSSPEQIKANDLGIDARTDVYALGVTLYEGVTGRVPFDGETTEQVFHQILEEEPISPRRLNPALPLDLDTIIVKAIEKEPAHRYQTMAELADDLQRFQNNEPILAKPAGLRTKLWKLVRRNPAKSALVVAILAILVTVSVVPWILATESRRREQLTQNANIEIEKQRKEAIAARNIADREKERALSAKAESDRQRDIADKRYQEIIRLSDNKRLSQLLAEETELWPAYPEKIPDMEAWLAKAEPLIDRIDTHKTTLNEWRDNAHQSADDPPEEGCWVFDNTEDQWKHDILAELVSGLSAFTDETTGTVKGVQDRLEFARSIYQESVEKHQQEWNDAINAISDMQRCPMYDGLLITPQVGLVPIGPDPDSGLWEFGHIQTGSVPVRGEEGKILLEESNGLVLILIPGGTFNMGAIPPTEENPIGTPNVDPDATKIEGPVHSVTLKSFFISKYEMTQGQWLRFTGENPSRFGPQDPYGGKKHPLLHPVETVSWNDCNRIFSRLALRLPSEAEWEYSARAMTSTIWWTGDRKESLVGALNIADQFCKTNGGEKDWNYETWLDDGYVTHSPVSAYKPNAFGLHNTCGNVWEWCKDTPGETYDSAPADGSPRVDKNVPYRVLRGGGWNMIADYCRSAYHDWFEPVDRSNNLGVRPARSVQ